MTRAKKPNPLGLIFSIAIASLMMASEGRAIEYGYDSLSRLTLVNYDDSNMVHYTYNGGRSRIEYLRPHETPQSGGEGNEKKNKNPL